MCERISAFGIGYNLVTYLVGNLHFSMPYAANMVTNFIGTSFLTCLIGGFFSDTWLGRYLTIVVFGSIQFLVRPHCSFFSWDKYKTN
jgi:dipeptide/tripeptide permease